MPRTSAVPPRVHRLSEAIRYFLWLGSTGFGGPVALCGLMERDLVEQRGWLDKQQMRDVIAVCQTMPGPLAVQVAIFMGYLRCGLWGAWASGWALILPASVMVGLLAAAYVHLHSLPWLTAVIYGTSPAVVALILQSWWRLVRLGMEDRFQSVVATVCLVATLVLPGLLTAMFLGAGLLGLGWYSLQARRRDASTGLHDIASFLLLAKLAWFFLITGAFTFGGGLAVVPLLQKGLVQQGHWLTTADFLAAIAVGMVNSRACDDRCNVCRLPRGRFLRCSGLHRRHLSAFVSVGSARGSSAHAASRQSARAGLRQGRLRSGHGRYPSCGYPARRASNRGLGNCNDRSGRFSGTAALPDQWPAFGRIGSRYWPRGADRICRIGPHSIGTLPHNRPYGKSLAAAPNVLMFASSGICAPSIAPGESRWDVRFVAVTLLG